ncbi:hypothetical protein BGZ83_008663 [Gryganskiella cystojenkinii]|nr:hypothetical protein BGZ83_008663 [Gryganskiella cystojenkinii]
MNVISNLIQNTTGVAIHSNAPPSILPQPQQASPLQFQRTTVSPLPPLQATNSNISPGITTVPPEIIHLIVNYLDNRELVKVITLNWTWAHICAAKLWQEVRYSASNSHRIVFLITKSVPTNPKEVTTELLSNLDRAAATSLADQGPTSSATTSTGTDKPPGLKRRNSYPWPTLLPYHAMIHALHVSLSSGDMIQDLLEIIPCCTELRSFSIQSAIPTEDLLLHGIVASACRDNMDSLDSSQGSSGMHLSASSASIGTTASASSKASSGRRPHSHSQSLSLDPYNTTTAPRAGLEPTDDETIMASSTAQSGQLFQLLASSCPKLQKLWFSGFHPVSVLGAPTDLRPRPPKFDLKSYQNQARRKNGSSSEPQAPRPPSFLNLSTTGSSNATAQLPPVPPVPGMNTAASSSTSTTTAQPTAASITLSQPFSTTVQHTQHSQSGIYSIHFVNCTIPPQYLMAMAQHSLPNLTELHLTQCWQGNPLQGSFIRKLAKLCPGLRVIDFHATQSHRGLVRSGHILQLLQFLEGREKASSGATSIADFPLGTFRGTSSSSGWSLSSGAARSTSSALVQQSNSNNSHREDESEDIDDSSADEEPAQTSVVRQPSNLESVSIWFTHSILDQAIVAELANKTRHPKLKHVEFGSEDAFDVGEDLARSLREQRPEVNVVWVNHADMGDDRDD